MLESTKPVGECSAQELIAALMLRAGFNEFYPKDVLFDLYAHPELWISFVMGPHLPAPSDTRLFGLLIVLRDLKRWHADTLYVLSRDDECVFPLVDMGKSWGCDDVEVIDRKRTGHLMGMSPSPAPIVVYWWD